MSKRFEIERIAIHPDLNDTFRLFEVTGYLWRRRKALVGDYRTLGEAEGAAKYRAQYPFVVDKFFYDSNAKRLAPDGYM